MANRGRFLLFTMVVGILVVLTACGQAAAPTAAPTQVVEAAAVVAPTPTPFTSVSDIAASGLTSTPTPLGERPVPGGTWTWSSSSGNSNPDPWHLIGFLKAPVFFNGLIQQKFPFDLSKGVEFEPYLATEYSQSADGSKWRFKLRQGVTWHDGEVFNADDVVATVQRGLDKEFLIHREGNHLRKVFVGVRKIDDYTVELDTGQANSTAFAWFTDHRFVIVPDHVIRGEDPSSTDVNKRWLIMHPNKASGPNYTGTLGVGTGPWKMTKFEPEVGVVGQRNPNYFKFDEYGNRLPYMDGWKMEVIVDGVRRLARFVAGENDFTLGTAAGMNPKEAKALCTQTKAPGCYTQVMPHGYFTEIMNHTNFEPFKDPKVAQAFRYAPDMDEIYRISYGGRLGFVWMDRERYPDTALSVKEQYEVLPWSNPDRRKEFLQKAKDLVAEAGYPKGFDLPFPVYGTGCTGSFLDQHSRTMDAWYRVGIRGFYECRAGVVGVEEQKSGRWSISSPGWPHILDPGAGVILWALLDSGSVGYLPWDWGPGQKEVDAIYRKTVKTVDPAKRNELYKEMERYLANPTFNHIPSGYAVVYYSAHGCVRDFSIGGIWQAQWYAQERVWLVPGTKCRE